MDGRRQLSPATSLLRAPYSANNVRTSYNPNQTPTPHLNPARTYDDAHFTIANRQFCLAVRKVYSADSTPWRQIII